MMVILPFEEAYFRQHNIPATFVGHPLIETLSRRSTDAEYAARLRSPGSPIVTCLPGSRGHVIDEVLPGQIEVCRAIAQRHANAAFVFAAASESAGQKIRASLRAAGFGEPAERRCIVRGFNHEAIEAADLVLVASGTATLEVAYHRRPMIVMYNASRWGYRLVARWLIQTPHLSLVNILAGRRLVPEYMPYYGSTAPIAQEALEILANDERRRQIQEGLDQLVRSLGTGAASEAAAGIVLDALDRATAGSPRKRGRLRGSRLWLG